MSGKTLRRTWNRFLLLTKKNLISPGIYILLAAALLAALLFRTAVFPTIENRHFGVYVEETDSGSYGKKILSDLMRKNGDNCVEVSDREELKQMVAAGNLYAGIIIMKNIDDIVQTGEPDLCMTFISGTAAAGGEALKEEVFADLLVYMDAEDLQRMTERDEVRQPLIRERFEAYLAGDDVLQVYFDTIDPTGEAYEDTGKESRDAQKTGAADRQNRRNSKAAADSSDGQKDGSKAGRNDHLALLLIFASALLFAGRRFRKEHLQMTAAMTPGDSRIWTFLEIFSPVLLIAVCMGIPCLLAVVFTNTAEHPLLWEILVWLLVIFIYCPIVSGYSALLASLFRSEAVYLFTMIGFLLLAVVTDADLVPAAAIFPQIRGLAYFFPVNWLPI